MAEAVDVTLLGERLKRTRAARSATLREVAEQAEVSIATLSRIERGAAKSVDSPTLLAIARWIGVDAQEFSETLAAPPGPAQPTPDIVELHLRADRHLDKRTAMALARMFRAAYESLAAEQRRRRTRP